MSSLVALWWAVADERPGRLDRVRLPSRETASGSAVTFAAADALLVERLRRGDEVAFRECYDAHALALWRYASRLLGSHDAAHDVVQDVFFSMFTRRDALVVRDSVRTYLFGAVRHAALNLLRHDTVAQRLAGTTPANGNAPAMGAPTKRPDEMAEQHDIEVRVMRALATLPERQRSAMILRWEHGLTAAQIARALGIADTVAGRLLLKAAKNLRNALADFER
jgi:RNA polymerase sigma-70 factor, ECF subfamily